MNMGIVPTRCQSHSLHNKGNTMNLSCVLLLLLCHGGAARTTRLAVDASAASLFSGPLSVGPVSRHTRAVSRHIVKPGDLWKWRPSVYYVSEVKSGGAKKYVDDLVKHYSTLGIAFHPFVNQTGAQRARFKAGDILLFQYLFATDLTFDFVRALVAKHSLRLVIASHDQYFLNDDPKWDHVYNASIHHMAPRPRLTPEKKRLFELAEYIVFPSEFARSVYKRHTDLDSMVVVPYIDHQLVPNTYVPPLTKCYNVGIITELSQYKGLDKLLWLFDDTRHPGRHYPRCVEFSVYSNLLQSRWPHVSIKGLYNETDIFDRLDTDGVHALLFLNNFPETYSYALTKGINSGRPIMFTDIGAVGERMREAGDSKYVATDNTDLRTDFNKLLAAVDAHAGMTDRSKLSKDHTALRPFYDRLLFESEASIMGAVDKLAASRKPTLARIHQSIEPYGVYFPQFHAIPENDRNFYVGFHDNVNLIAAKAVHKRLLTPLKNVLGFYDLKRDAHVVDNQVRIAQAYGFRGFAIYYYWFSTNTVTNSSTVFEDVVDRFFEEALPNFSVFFVYCNEAWTKNKAFSSRDGLYSIENSYDEVAVTAMLSHLVPYFRHANYRKVNNKPLFFIHHPFEMTDPDLARMQRIGDAVTMRHGFAGLQLVVDRRDKNRPGYANYYTHANYKTTRENTFVSASAAGRQMDYGKYVFDFLPDEAARDGHDIVNTVFTNFDNTVRFFQHDNPGAYVSYTVNNGVALFKRFLDAQFAKYSAPKSELSRIFLVNAWNEWGEQMVMEPSNELGFRYLAAFYGRLKSHFGQ